MQHFDPGGGCGIEADPFVTEIRVRLRRQEWMLQATLDTLEAERHSFPTHSVKHWKGLAQVLYDQGLDGLRQQLLAAITHVDDALRETRRALQTIDAQQPQESRVR